MIEKNRQTGSRIPVHFVDDEKGVGSESAGGELTADELGRASSYEHETEMRQRMNRGAEEGSGGDERDDAGAPRDSELPENREDRDTLTRDARSQSPDAGGSSSGGQGGAQKRPSLISPEAELLAAQAETRMLEDELQKIKGDRQELNDLVARRQADFDNYRKRTERERAETYSRIVGEVASHILPVADNLRRACEAEASVESNESGEFSNFLHGVELISRQLNGVLESMGVVPVETVGKPFDPHVHEAVATERTEEFEPDTVMQEIQRGYRIGEKLLRPAMVKVATR